MLVFLRQNHVHAWGLIFAASSGSVSSKHWGIFSAPDSIFSPQNAPDVFSAPIGKLKKTPRKKPPFSPKSASSGGHLFWPPPVRADFDSIQKLNKIYLNSYCVCKIELQIRDKGMIYLSVVSYRVLFSQKS